MEGESRFGKIFLYTKDTGSMIGLMEEAGLFMLMGMYMRVSGRRVSLMDRVYTFIKMD